MSAQPSKTLYVNNLNDKVKKPELRQQLYQLFTPYGRVVDIVALKTAKMRGQAHVVFLDQVAATTALRALGGEPFYGKPLKITYSKSVSRALMPASQSTAPGSNVVLSTAQREADDLKRSREEEDTIRERADKRARGEDEEGDEAGETNGQAAGDDEDDMDMDEDEDDAPGPKP